MDVTGLDIQGGSVPNVESGAPADSYVLPIAGDLRMVEQEPVRSRSLSSRSPLPANLAGLRVVPATPQVLIVNNDERPVADRLAAGRDLNAVVIIGYGQIGRASCRERV